MPPKSVLSPSWITWEAGEFGGGVRRIQVDGQGVPQMPGRLVLDETEIGEQVGDLASGVDVDADGRIWISVNSSANSSGGLRIYETDEEDIRTADALNWRGAPIGDRSTDLNQSMWESPLQDVAAADERIWTGRFDGQLITFAQRWSQLDESNAIGDKSIQDLWTVRGRLFAGTSANLYVLLPDGQTWDSRPGKVWDVVGDSRGNIWVGTNAGPRIYQAEGWDELRDRVGARPARAIYAIAEDGEGRIWLGGLDGLTLFDRDRFVTTLTASNSPLPATSIRALLVDRDNRLWVGTDSGLAVRDGETWQVLTTTHGLPTDDVRDLAQLAEGRIAVSTTNGLAYVDDTLAVQQEMTLPLPAYSLRLAVDERDQLWADSAVLTASGWQVYYDTNSGLRSPEISGVAADHADRVWFSHAPDTGVSVRGAYLPPLGHVVPCIETIDRTSGREGSILTLTGTGFGESKSELQVTIGGSRAEIISVTNRTLRVRIGPDTTSGDISVSRAGQRSTAEHAFRAEPVITSFTPTGGNAGVRITIHGTNFDRNAQVTLGTGPARPAFFVSPTELSLFVQPTDKSGVVEVQNFAPWSPAQDPIATQSATEFQLIELTLQHLALNQGIEFTGLVADRPTLVQSYLKHSVDPRPDDRLEIDRAEYFVNGSEEPTVVPFCPFGTDVCTNPVYTRPGDVGASEWRDIKYSLNFTMSTAEVGGVDVRVKLWRRDQLVAEGSTSALFRPNIPLRVLLVPIMRNGYDDDAVQALQRDVDPGLDELRRRIMPSGNVEFYWSPITYSVDDVLTGHATKIDIGDFTELYDASHNLDRARRWWNANRDPNVLVSFGVVDTSIVEGDNAGLAFWPDVSEMLNNLGLNLLDTLCDFANTVLNVISLGFLGSDDGCDLEIPLYVGWAQHDGLSGGVQSQQSALFGHEIGHIMGLVKPWAANGTDLFPLPFVTDNLSHSLTDELDGGYCGEDGTSFNSFKTLYFGSGVGEPVVNPLAVASSPGLSDQQLRRKSEDGAAGSRGKAIMSYACGRTNDNVFFEPVDDLTIFQQFATSSAMTFFHDLSGLSFSAASDAVAQGSSAPASCSACSSAGAEGDMSGERVYVSGELDQVVNSGSIIRVEPLGSSAPLDLSFESGYAIVQLDAAGAEVSRLGVWPQFSVVGKSNNAEGFFAATLLRHPDTVRFELRHEDAVLDAFQPGSAAPSVVWTESPAAGQKFSSGVVRLGWTASDPDDDPLNVVILYSPDDGGTWSPMAFPAGDAYSIDIPVERLANSVSGQARFQIVVTDGLNTASALSEPFMVHDVPPRPWIGFPTADASTLEGRLVGLSGGAYDNLDLQIGNAGLSWSSDRDGLLGTGADLDVFLSVGTHQITLEATNSSGDSASTTTTMHVLPDYDGDGVTDPDELLLHLNPLSSREMYTDVDGDGVIRCVEMLRGTNPYLADSDGDGRSDADEIVDGTDPTSVDEPLPADEFQIYPPSLSFTGDLARDVPYPQQQVQLMTRAPADWTLTADVPWLAASAREGQSPAGVTILVDAHLLDDGMHLGQLTFTCSTLGSSVTVPVTVTITNSELHFDVNDDGILDAQDYREIEAHVGLDHTQAGFSFRYDVNRDGMIDTHDTDLTADRLDYPPVVVEDEFTTEEDTPLSIAAPGVLANDRVRGTGTPHVLLNSPTSHGALKLGTDGSFTYAPAQRFNREDTFEYYVDDGTYQSEAVTVTITITTAYPWYNGSNHFDVNDDTHVTPIDALLVINELNRNGGYLLNADRIRPLAKPFYDVNRDGYISPIDALQVINHLNRVGDGEGEMTLGNAVGQWWSVAPEAASAARSQAT